MSMPFWIARPAHAPQRRAYPGRVVLISAAAVLGGFLSGFVARIVKSWPNRPWPVGQGTGPGTIRARRPAPERDPEASANPPITRGARP